VFIALIFEANAGPKLREVYTGQIKFLQKKTIPNKIYNTHTPLSYLIAFVVVVGPGALSLGVRLGVAFLNIFSVKHGVLGGIPQNCFPIISRNLWLKHNASNQGQEHQAKISL
jgi:hypothetical protein